MSKKYALKIKILVSMIVVIMVGCIGFLAYEKISSYAQDGYYSVESDGKYYPLEVKKLIKEDQTEITVELEEEYGIKNRIIRKNEPNKTGIKIIFRDGSWLYMDEYVGSKTENSGLSVVNFNEIEAMKGQWVSGGVNSIGISSNIKDNRVNINEGKPSALDIVAFEVAAGYEVTIEGRTVTTTNDGKKNRKIERGTTSRETTIMGPLRLMGKCESEYIVANDNNGSFEDSEHVRHFGEMYFKYNLGADHEEDMRQTVNKLGINLSLKEVERMYNRLWDYNHAKCWSSPGDPDEGEGEYDRNNVKIYEIETIKLKKISLKEGVYLMKSVYNVVNAPKGAKEVKSIAGAYEYISPELPSANEEYDEEYDENSMKYYPADLRTKNIVNSLMVVGPYTVKIQQEHEVVGDGTFTEWVEITGKKGKIINPTNLWRVNTEDGENGPNYSNDLSWIQIMPVTEGGQEDDEVSYNKCMFFHEDENFMGGFSTEETMDSIKRYGQKGISYDCEKKELVNKKNKKGTDYYTRDVKFFDMPQEEEDPVVTVYTERNFRGQYFRIHRGETNSIGYDGNIAKIRSLEIAPNTRVIFSDDKTGKNNLESDVFAIEGPCEIEDLEECLLSYFNDKGTLAVNNGFSKLKSIAVVAQKVEDVAYTLCRQERGIAVIKKGRFYEEDKEKNKIDIGNNFVQSMTINGNYFAKFYDKDGKRVKTLVGPFKNARIGLDDDYRDKVDKLHAALKDYIKYVDNYALQDKLRDEASNTGDNSILKNWLGIDLNGILRTQAIIDKGYKLDEIVIEGYGFDMMPTKVREAYLRLACNILDTPDNSDEYKNILKPFAQNYVNEYYAAKDVPVGQSWIKDYTSKVDDNGRRKWLEGENAEKYKAYFKEFINNKNDSWKIDDKTYTRIPEQSYIQGKLREERTIASAKLESIRTVVSKDLCEMYDRYNNMTMRIAKSTQRDMKGRSVENMDGIVLYQNKNFNENTRAEENVWTMIRVNDEGKLIWNGGISETIDLTDKDKEMEIDYSNVGSVRISGSLLGRYKIKLTLGDGREIESRTNISSLGAEIKSITLEEISKGKEFDILLDSAGGGTSVGKTAGIKVATEDKRVVSAGDFVEEDTSIEKKVNRDVYLVDILDVIDKLGVKYEYVYKCDPNGNDADELVGVKFTRDIGEIKTNDAETKETYQDIDANVKGIVREIEVKFNQKEESVELALMGMGLPLGMNGAASSEDTGIYVSSDEYNQTKDSRGLIITDHGYLENKTNIKNDTTVLVRNYRDVMEVPAMLINEINIRIQQADGEKPSYVRYLSIADTIDKIELVRENTTSGASTESTNDTSTNTTSNKTTTKGENSNNKSGGTAQEKDYSKVEYKKLHLYVPACYKEEGTWHTSYLLTQLGIKATNQGNDVEFSA